MKHVNRRGEIVDDLAFNEQQKRKRAPKPKPDPAMLNTSCCGTCENWIPSTNKKDPYGRCAVTIAIDHGSREKATMHTAEEARQQRLIGPSMRCAGSFVCSQYHGPHELLPIAHANVEFHQESTAMHDLIQADRGEWEWSS